MNAKLGCGTAVVRAELRELQKAGYQLLWEGSRVRLDRAAGPLGNEKSPVTISLKKTEVSRFGIISDTHLGSKFERLDVAEAAYDHFAKEGITTVLHAGNMVDGESRFNRYDLAVHGLADQTHYCAVHYPQRKGITTFYIDGDDHEGWWTQREGVRFGPYLEMYARNMDRTDLRYLGYAEADIPIKAEWMERPGVLRIVHPGGGTAYAHSYQAQKIVESYGPNGKPDVLVVGHYHKMGYFRPRGVHCILAGCTQDQTTWMRKQHIEAHLGWWIVGLKQDKRGAVVGLECEASQVFDRRYYA